MAILFNVAILILAYFLGSIPTSVWLGKRFFGVDIREHGSRNAGSTNAIRILGWKAGLGVLVFDVFKGWLAVNLIHLTEQKISLQKNSAYTFTVCEQFDKGKLRIRE